MIIGLDFTWMSNQNQCGGVCQYAMRLLTALVRYTKQSVVVIISEGCESFFDDIPDAANLDIVSRTESRTITKIVEQNKIEVIHTPIQHHMNFTLAVPMITTLHDLQHFYFPEFFTQEEILFRNIYYKKSAEFSERVIVSYHHVKNDLLEFYGVPLDKIDVCGHGMDATEKVTTELIEQVRKKYNLTSSYLLYTANTWRHKNHIGLVRAMKVLKEKHGLQPELICTGVQYPDFFPEIEAEIKVNGLGEQIRFLGYLPEEEMPAILCGATLSVVPTLYEAGSFPLMEAMNYGIPVICAATTSLPDTIGDRRFVFDPNSPEEIAEKIAIMLTDEKMRQANIANSSFQVSKWRWDKAILPYIECYQKAIDSFQKKKNSRWYHDWALNYELMALKLENRLRCELVSYSEKLARCNASLEKVRNQYENDLRALKSSLSWRLTAPLRKLGTLIGFRGRKG